LNKIKLYFFSDFHLGMPQGEVSINREKKIVNLLQTVSSDAHSIFLLGDIFDFWFEYREVVPKGYFRLLNIISELTGKGIKVYLFPGNHDLWYGNYLVEHCGVELLKEPTEFFFCNKKFHIHHGDGLGPGDYKYKLLKKVFIHPISKFIFKWLHPDIGVRFARFLSSKSRLSQGTKHDNYLGDDKEFLTQYCLNILKKQHRLSKSEKKVAEVDSNQLKTKDIGNNQTDNYGEKHLLKLVEGNNETVDFFVFGHRHLVLDIQLPENSRYINLGHWLRNCHYGVFDGVSFNLISVE
jgi:UDP-2,3-diacylglucosamine hydrolase